MNGGRLSWTLVGQEGCHAGSTSIRLLIVFFAKNMRITLDLPDNLMRELKVRAALLGVKLKNYFTAELYAILDSKDGG